MSNKQQVMDNKLKMTCEPVRRCPELVEVYCRKTTGSLYSFPLLKLQCNT